MGALQLPERREDTPPLSAGPRLRDALGEVQDAAARAPTVDQVELYRDVVVALETARRRGHDLSAAAVGAVTRWEKRSAVAAAPPVGGISTRTSER